MFKNLSIKWTIISTVGILTGLMLVLSVVGLTAIQQVVGIIEGVSLRDARQQAMIGEVKLLMETNRSQILQALQHNPTTGYARMHDHPLSVHFTAITENTAKLKEAWTRFDNSLQTPEGKRLAKEWFAKSDGLAADMVLTSAAALQAEKWDEAENILIKQINPTFKAADPAYRALANLLATRGADNVAVAHREIGFVQAMMLAAAAISLIIGVGATMFLLRGILRPLEDAVRIARHVKDGDLTVAIDSDLGNEFGVLQASLREMRDSLAQIVSQVRSGTDTIATASAQVAAGSQDLSSRTEEQASSLEETATSMEELTSTVKQNAGNARQANVLAESASAVAAKGGAVIGEVVGTMAKINDSAKKIVDIIAVIDGIAFQTNILALNAAVEAARAGEQGRGFAVVASEVRTLAQRSANAAKEVKALIGDSVDKVENGSRLVNDAGATMTEIVESVRRVADIMAEISAASAEQTAGIEQINVAVAQMDQVTQQNAALVEEAAAASESMQDQAAKLSQVVSVFKLNAIQEHAFSMQHGTPDRSADRAMPHFASAAKAALPKRPAPKRLIA